MKNNTIFFLSIGVFIGCLIVVGYSYNIDSNKENNTNWKIDLEEVDNLGNKERLYQGPIPLEYDEDHFRKTGETIKEVDK